MTEAPTAIVCDDAPGFRALMTALLEEVGLRVVNDCGTWAEAEELAAGVDVIVVDLWMPEIEIDALTRIRAGAPQATLAVITALALDEARERIGAVEVDLLLSKSAPPAEVAAAIADQAQGRAKKFTRSRAK